jgi:YggT family protein
MASTTGALFFLVTALFNLTLCAFLLRILLQLTRSDFYNPISQLIWSTTQPVVGPLARYLKRWKRFDIGGAIVLFGITIAYVWVISQFDVAFRIAWPTMVRIALLKIFRLTLNLYTLSLFALAIMSWVGPGVSNPTANVLWSLNEPLLRPVRQILPPVSGLDLSPIPVMLILQTLDHWIAPLLGPFH